MNKVFSEFSFSYCDLEKKPFGIGCRYCIYLCTMYVFVWMFNPGTQAVIVCCILPVKCAWNENDFVSVGTNYWVSEFYFVRMDFLCLQFFCSCVKCILLMAIFCCQNKFQQDTAFCIPDQSQIVSLLIEQGTCMQTLQEKKIFFSAVSYLNLQE